MYTTFISARRRVVLLWVTNNFVCASNPLYVYLDKQYNQQIISNTK